MADRPAGRERVEAARDRAEAARERARERARLTFRRLSGLDRSGPPPPETLKGAPLRPWTIPNAIGFARLALIPVFLYLVFSSRDGVSAWGAVIFAIVAWTDYLDGIAARATGQYSRLGTLMDPLTDRLLILSGVVACWYWELLPRWALAVLAAREAAMLVLVRLGLRHGLDIRINWPGRIAVWPVMAALFAGLAGLDTLGAWLLYVGLFFALWATWLYIRDGLAQRSS
jgi:cardiolipin synthase (CMP-forming)